MIAQQVDELKLNGDVRSKYDLVELLSKELAGIAESGAIADTRKAFEVRLRLATTAVAKGAAVSSQASTRLMKSLEAGEQQLSKTIAANGLTDVIAALRALS